MRRSQLLTPLHGNHAESAIGAIWDPCRTNRCLRPVTAAHAGLLRPATRPPHLGSRPGPGLGSVLVLLVHPRPGPFTSDRPHHVRAGHGRWRPAADVRCGGYLPVPKAVRTMSTVSSP